MKGLKALAAGFGALFLVACGDGGVQSPDFTPVLTELEISPATATVAIGETATFEAIGTFTAPPGSNPEFSVEPVEPTWTSSNTAIATVDGNGVVTGVSAGVVTLTASSEGIDAEAIVTVPEPTLLSIAITPDPGSVAVAGTLTFTATGTFQNGTSPTFTGPVTVTWTSSAAGVATINGSGVATGVAEGTTTITATSGEIDDTATLTVTPFEPALTALVVQPATASVPLGDSATFTAIGTFTTPPGSPTPTTSEPVAAVWSSASPAIATIDADSGVAISQSVGTTTVTAAFGGLTANATFAVTAPVLRGIEIVDPDDAAPRPPILETSLPKGTTQRYMAVGIYSDQVRRDIPGGVTWVVEQTSVATVAPANEATTTATAVAVGETDITATSVADDSLSASTHLTVTAAELTTLLRVEPPLARVVPGASAEFTAIGRYTDATEATLQDADLVWSSSAPSVATIDANGFATGVEKGLVTITATLNDATVPASVTPRSAVAQLRVTDPACTTPLLSSEGATVADNVNGLCVLCSVSNSGYIIDEFDDNFGLMSVPVGLLGGSTSVTVTPGSGLAVPFPAGNQPGFVIGRPTGSLVLAELFSQIHLTTLRNGEPVETSGSFTPLRLDLLGLGLIGSSELVLASFEATQPYDAIRLSYNSGVVSALTSVQVFQACATTTPPIPAAELTGLASATAEPDTIEVGSSTDVIVIGDYEDDSQAPVQDSDLDWTSSAPAVATVDANGVVTGVSPGSVTITATLKPDVSSTTGPRSISITITVIATACTSPLLASQGATIEGNISGLCLLCSTPDGPNVIDEVLASYGLLSVPVSLLGGSASFTVTAAPETEFEEGGRAGFIIGRPAGSLLQVELLSQIEVSTLLGSEVQDSSSEVVPLRLDLLGLNLVGDTQTALASIATTKPFDAVRVTFNGGVASLLTSVQVIQACSATLP